MYLCSSRRSLVTTKPIIMLNKYLMSEWRKSGGWLIREVDVDVDIDEFEW